MVLEVFNYTGEIEEKNYAYGIPQEEHFIGDIEFKVNYCPFCWRDYNWRLVVNEHRPVMPSDKGRWPILLILPYWKTRWGRQDLRVLHPKGRKLLHYKNKLEGVTLILLREGSRFLKGETIRRTILLEGVPEVIWAHEGYTMHYIALEEGETVDIYFKEIMKHHYRCKGLKPQRVKLLYYPLAIWNVYPNGFNITGVDKMRVGDTKWGEVFQHNFNLKEQIDFLSSYNIKVERLDHKHAILTPLEGGVQIPPEDLIQVEEEVEAGY